MCSSEVHAQETWKTGLHLALAWDGRAFQLMLIEPAESIYRCPNKPWDTYFLPMVNAGNGDRPKWCHLVREPEPMLAAAGRRGASSVKRSAMQSLGSSVGQGMVPRGHGSQHAQGIAHVVITLNSALQWTCSSLCCCMYSGMYLTLSAFLGPQLHSLAVEVFEEALKLDPSGDEIKKALR